MSSTLSVLRRVRALQAPLARVVMFPFAGGSASSYCDWTPCFSPNIDVVHVQLPGRETRIVERAHRRIEDAVAELVPALMQLSDRPLLFFGHSMGALLAYEAAIAMRAWYGTLPADLVVSGRRPPHVASQSQPLHELEEPEFRAAVRALGGLPADLDDEDELIQLMLPTWRADIELCETYTPREHLPLPVPICALGGQADPLTANDGLDGWALHTSEPFERHLFAGGHFFIQEPESQPAVQRLIAQRILDVAQGRSPCSWVAASANQSAQLSAGIGV
jgi:medium-chain acyl-[acyl-carrier-protein] hydrolase